MFGWVKNIFSRSADPLGPGAWTALAGNPSSPFDPQVLTPQRAYRVISVIQNAISKIANSAGKAKIRLFDLRGNEITGGSLFELLSYPGGGLTENGLKHELFSWYLLTGEAFLLFGDSQGNPTASAPSQLRVVNPATMRITAPSNPIDISDVQQWEWQRRDGRIINLTPYQIAYAKSFSAGEIRGISPLMSASHEMMCYYNVWRHCSSYFERGAGLQGIMSLPDYSQEDVKEFRQQFNDKYTGVQNSWKLFFANREVKFSPIEHSMKDSLSTEIVKAAEAELYKIYSVPPIISGDWANAKYDSADAQSEAYAENVLLPILDTFTDMLQTQLVNRYQWDIQTSKQTMSRSLKKQFERAVEGARSPIVVLIDSDTLPVASVLKEKRIESAKTLIESFRLSPDEASEYYDLDLPQNEWTDKVYIPSNMALIDPPTPEPMPNVDPNQDSSSQDPNQDKAEEPTKEQVSKVAKAFLAMRVACLKRAEAGEPIRLRDLYEHADSVPLKRAARDIYARINPSGGRASSISVRNVFSVIPRSLHRKIAEEISHEE